MTFLCVTSFTQVINILLIAEIHEKIQFARKFAELGDLMENLFNSMNCIKNGTAEEN